MGLKCVTSHGRSVPRDAMRGLLDAPERRTRPRTPAEVRSRCPLRFGEPVGIGPKVTLDRAIVVREEARRPSFHVPAVRERSPRSAAREVLDQALDCGRDGLCAHKRTKRAESATGLNHIERMFERRPTGPVIWAK